MDRHSAHVLVVRDAGAAADAGAHLWVDAVRQALAARGVFHVALSGGSTPRELFRRVAEQPDLDYAWHRTHVYWVDERAVPLTDPRSNYALAVEELLEAVPLSPEQIHPMEADDPDLEAAARRYEKTLTAGIPEPQPLPPALDLVWLGLGTDGHTASLFPRSPVLGVRDRWVAAVENPSVQPPRRLTLTVPVLNAARRVVFLVTGADKAEAVAGVLEGEHDPERRPAQLVQPPPGRLVFLLDERAASGLARARG